MNLIASRDFNLAYIILDCIFLLVFILLLTFKKKYLTVFWGLFGGILYFAVDYGIFHLLTGSRSIEGGNMFWVLLWMSMSYGFTNFAWIWLCLDKDVHIKEWTILIFSWWVACPMLSEMFPSPAIHIQRTTGAYHGIMGGILFLSYLGIIFYNLKQKDRQLKINILWLWIIGVSVQFGWEFALLIGGIRSSGVVLAEQLRTLVVNSFVETNLGMPLIYLIYLTVTSKVKENLCPNHQTIKERFTEHKKLKYSRTEFDLSQYKPEI